MRIMIVNGNPVGEDPFDEYLDDLAEGLKQRGHDLERFDLREMKLIPCTGCFSCWFRTPGLCVLPDDSDRIRRSFVHADLALFTSPLIMGLFSALLKNLLDKLVPLVLPHLTVVEGEVHHHLRYRRQPMLGAILGEEDDTTGEDLAIVHALFERNALNVGGRMALFETTARSKGEILDAIDSL